MMPGYKSLPGREPFRIARRRLVQEQRRAILDAALRDFAESGFRDATVHDVASRAGVSVGQIYNLVGNKHALYEAVVRREARRFEKALDAALERLADRPPAEKIDGLLEMILRYFDARRDAFRIHLRAAGERACGWSTTRTGHGVDVARKLEGALQILFEEAAQEGELGDLEPEEARLAFGQLLLGFVGQWFSAGCPGSLASRLHPLRRVITHGILSAESRRPSVT